ncbi:MAG: hypothetical protein OXG82_01360 [Gammaproteobacteria bacterium]|nr:hypothetical protein [Gammaproteobacteria bacterium]
MWINLLIADRAARQPSSVPRSGPAWRRAAGRLSICLAIVAWPLAAFGQDEGKAPVLRTSVPDVVLFADDPTLGVNLSGVFANRPTECFVESSDESVVRVGLRGFKMQVEPVGVGEATITITARNRAGSVTTTLTARVVDREPQAVGQLPAVTVIVGRRESVDVSSAFTGTNLAFAVASSAEETAAATLSGTTVTVAGGTPGNAELTITAENTAGSATQAMTVTVKDDPPVAVGTLADEVLTVGHALDVDFADSFGGTNLVFSVSSSAPDAATATLSGTSVLLDAVAPAETVVTVTAENTEGSAAQTFTVTVKDEPPAAVGTLADEVLTVGDAHEVGFADAFSGTNLVFSISSSVPDAATATVSGTSVVLDAVEPGETVVTVTAENTEGSAAQAFTVTVKDEPPAAVGTLADAMLIVGDAHEVGFADAFSGTNLVFSVSSSAPDAATATVSGTSVVLDAVEPGETVVTVTAENTEGSAAQAFTVTVKDQPPAALGMLEDLTLTVGDTHEVEIADSFSGTNLVFSATSSVPDAATVALSGTSVVLDAVAPGEAVVTVTAENTEGSATRMFTVTVKDEPPATVGMLEDVTLTVGDTHGIDIAGAFSGTNLLFSVASSAPDMAPATLSGTTVTIAGLVAGDATLTVTAENSEGSVTQSIAVTVRDHPPVAVGTLPDLTLTVADTHEVDVADGFGGTALIYSVASSASDMASVSLAGTTVTLTALAAGETTVMVTAENSEGSATQAFSVVVEDQLPTAVGTLSDLTLTVGDTMDVNIAGAFTGSALVFSAMSSSEQMATANLNGTTVTVAALVAGRANVTVTAENTAGMATQVFAVTVEDQLPTTIGSLPNVALRTGGDPVFVDVAGAFDGTALVYTVSASGDAVSATVAGGQVTVAPLVEGGATVTVTATNSAGAATQSFRATVTTDAAESAALNQGFAAIGASTLSSVTSAIGARFRSGGGGAASGPVVANAWQAGHSAQSLVQPGLSTFGADGWLGESRWRGSMPGLGGYGSFNAAAAPDVKWEQPARWTFWGHADRQSFEGMGYDGSLTSIYVGADADFGERWLAGFAVSRSVGEAGYEFTSAQARGFGDIETETLSIFPYVHWSLDDDAEAWAILGFGWGDADHVRTATAQRGMADVSMVMASVGGRRTLASADEWEVSLLGDVSLLEMETDGGVGIVNDLDAGVSRLRAGLEAARNIALEGGGTVTWFGQVAARHDDGDGETGGGAEVSGGLRYDSSGRFGFEAKARMLAMHAADDYEENGFSVAAFVRPGPDGDGLSFSLSSHAGPGMGPGGESLIHGHGQPGVDAWPGRDDWAVDLRLGYTILDHRSSGLLTPFAEVDVAENRGHTMLGIALDFSGRRALDRLNLEFAGGHGHHELRGAAGGVFAMRGELRF